ncbi:uncharacterized protein PAC_17682 [Phialocephala subalpina]|uniref:Uncharacterized protein n=1 Tax=Phialocephala subalpina TaxID=576137 RepID=A0A1L7XRW4_9HELO|nr:uncharacterized protein PAC_17682 [Phialocephala subalpina]
MPSSTTTIILQTLSISTSFIAAGGTASLSLFDIPILKSQPDGGRPLPPLHPLALQPRLPQLSPSRSLSSAGFAYLAFTSLDPGQSISQLLRVLSNSGKVNGYLAAAALSMSIGPFTRLGMIPTNSELIEINEKRDGKRSERSARDGREGKGTATSSVNGEGEGAEFTDLSGPQERTEKEITAEDNERVNRLLEKFEGLNATRAVLIGAGGLVGLVTALL